MDLDLLLTRGRGVRHVHTCLMHGNREASEGAHCLWWAAGNRGKATSRTPRGRRTARPFEESDAGVVPEKSAKTWATPVESMEGRPKAEGKLVQRNASRTLSREDARTHLERVGPQEEEGGGTTTGRLTTDGPRSSCASVDPRWEPGAGNPLAGLCPGGGPSRPMKVSEGPSLPGPGEQRTLRPA